ncbi:MAG TPA: hypothetical protein VFE78_11235 [Gemmataceae bacterium]|nr:hypothetical protein [Gemmataceae bacterium]
MTFRAPRAGPGFLFFLCFFGTAPADGAEPPSVPPAYLRPLTARPLGPANMGGRVTALAVVEGRPSTQYLGAAAGGLWKTTNNGITWAPVFDGQATPSIGDVAVAPSDPAVVWVGTGEANPRNSVSWGSGVYRSGDGGKTWQHRGLDDTHHIGRVVVHPRRPDTVYVAALGHLWGPNRQRGVFKTEDGGRTWRHVLAPAADTGCVDLVMAPDDPETLYAAAWRVRRDGFAGGNPAVQFGPAAGLYRTRDGGRTWERLSAGLPRRPLGRCGLAVSHSDPAVLYAVVQSDLTDVRKVPGQAAGDSGDPDTGGVFRSADRGETWAKVNDLCPRPFYFGQVRVAPHNPRRVYVLGLALHVSTDGGRTFRPDGARDAHADHHALWIDPADPDHLLLGGDGGLWYSYDRGQAWEHVRNLPLAQFYGIALDRRKPYRVYGGLQDNGTWGGPSRTRRREGITAADWTRLLSADGFRCAVDPSDSETVYAEFQYGGLRRVNVRTGAEIDVRPRRAASAPAWRFNWSAPLLLSPHDARTVYFGGNVLFRSADRGDRWRVVSPDLTRGGPGPSAHTGHTLSAVAESPLRPGLLYAGSDDGRVHATRDGGLSWADVSARVSGVPAERWVTHLECSPFAEGTAYLALDRHRQDDRAPYLFKTDDYGETWRSLSAGLPPEGPVHVVRADARRRGLLFAGTEFGLFFSPDDGATWQALRHGLPPAPVRDLVIHPRDRELVIATHGRGLFVLDVAPLEEMTAAVLAAPAHLFDVKPATAFHNRGARGLRPGKNYLAPNPPFGAAIYYALRARPDGPLRLTVLDARGRVVAELPAASEPGLHRAQWGLRPGPAGGADAEGFVPPGEYAVQLQAGGKVWTKRLRVEAEE